MRSISKRLTSLVKVDTAFEAEGSHFGDGLHLAKQAESQFLESGNVAMGSCSVSVAMVAPPLPCPIVRSPRLISISYSPP